MEELVRRYLCLFGNERQIPCVLFELVCIEDGSDGVIGGEIDSGGISSHIECREAGNTTIEQRVLAVFELFLLVVVSISSAAGAYVVDTIFVEVFERVVVTG